MSIEVVLDREECVDWLAARGYPTYREGAATLAELFALVEGYDGEQVSRPLGFVA